MLNAMLLFFLVISSDLFGETIPDPRDWVEQLAENHWTQGQPIFRNITIVADDPVKLKDWDTALGDFSKLGYLQYLDQQSLTFQNRLNPGFTSTWSQKDPPSEFLPLHLVLKVKGSRMAAFVPFKNGFKSIAHWKISKSDQLSSQAFLAWLLKKLGYDGIVLDVKQELLLVGLFQNEQELGQGILIKNGSTKWAFESDKVEGEALLQALRIEGSLAVFEVFLQKDQLKSIVPGSKIILGKRRSIKGAMDKLKPSEVSKPNAEPK